MRRYVALCYLLFAAVFTGGVVYLFTRVPPDERQPSAAAAQQLDDRMLAELPVGAQIGVHASPPPPKLPETDPPSGLPIQAWGPRDCFPVIRDPWYVSAQQGDSLLAADEPVLGVVVDWQAKAAK